MYKNIYYTPWKKNTLDDPFCSFKVQIDARTASVEPALVGFQQKPPTGKTIIYNVGITIINRPFGNSLYKLSMVIRGMVYCCYTHMNGKSYYKWPIFDSYDELLEIIIFNR